MAGADTFVSGAQKKNNPRLCWGVHVPRIEARLDNEWSRHITCVGDNGRPHWQAPYADH